MNKLRRVVVSFLILFFTQAYSQAEVPGDSLDNILVSDLTENWLFYDQQFKTFFPYRIDKKERTKSISQLIDLNKYKSYNLNFIASPGLSLFIDQKLFYRNNSAEKEYARIKIEDLVGLHNTEKELISFYHPKGHLPTHNFY